MAGVLVAKFKIGEVFDIKDFSTSLV